MLSFQKLKKNPNRLNFLGENTGILLKTLKEFREDKLWGMGLSRIYLVINIKIRQSFCSQSRIYPIKASVILSKRYSERGFNVINVFILVFIFLQ